MEGKLIGAIVVTDKGDEGMIVDKVLSYCNQSNYTKYVIMKKDCTIVHADFDEITEVIQLPGGNPLYFDRKEFTL